jgi:hypothetical protein
LAKANGNQWFEAKKAERFQTALASGERLA